METPRIYSESLGTESLRLATITLNYDEVPSITLKAFEFSSPTRPEFHALSYTWNPPYAGDPLRYTEEDMRDILLNGSKFSVMPNLYDAFFQLHRSYPDMPFWIDALCINQKDLQERKLQVGIMDRIFGGASRVIVWLGKPNPKIELGLKAVERLASVGLAVSKRIVREQKYHYTHSIEEMKDAYGLEPISFDEADALITLFDSRWFARQWVIQEVALAKEIDVVCNDMAVPFEKIGSTALFLHFSGLLVAISVTLVSAGKDSQLLEKTHLFQAERTLVVREWCKGERSEIADELPLIDFTAGVVEGVPATGQTKESMVGIVLLKLLMWVVGYDATDRRDTIYGLGGILSHVARIQGLDSIPQRLQPDYQLDTATVLYNAATEILLSTGSLALLGVVKDASLRETPDLPSWVPDYTPKLLLNPMAGPNFKSLGKFDASQSLDTAKYEVDFHVDGKVLHARGFPLGRIKATGESLKVMFLGDLTGCAAMLIDVDETYRFTNQPFEEAFWRTLIFDQDLSDRPARIPTTEHFQHLVLILMIGRMKATFESGGADAVEAFLKTLGPMDELHALHPKQSPFYCSAYYTSCARKFGLIPEAGDDKPLAYEELIAWLGTVQKNAVYLMSLLSTTLSNRRPAVTEQGHFACVFQSSLVGDEIWVVSGCPTPLVLRKDGQRYSLVGEAYVHGVMHGEAVNEDSKWEDLEIV
ncbi:related to heterokaryon incompatibility protein (het-6OR allele) [Fusarium torulosum]|uniref:Related to heterokaryon incompatibility protein (Het-6OR allele) n=1 Tax=Fusarium torulosum TaxID=33205 RepID=A0AAE8MC06_9HYPO|nr:related to heterokaryon incompatibility protein (het-6OR allele) [Fusarium torulosum]